MTDDMESHPAMQVKTKKYMKKGIYDDLNQLSVREVAEKKYEESAQSDLPSDAYAQYPASLKEAAEILTNRQYQVIDKSQNMNVLWVVTTKDAGAELAKLLGEQYTMTWNKRGMIQTDNKSFFSVRRK